MRATKLTMQIGWMCLAVVSLGVLVFGVVVAVAPMAGDVPLYRAYGLASIGLGLFGGLIVLVPYRRTERWAWWTLWFYPVFWAVHLLGKLPPGTDHIHQVAFIALSLIGLPAPVRAFFPRRRGPAGPGGARSSVPSFVITTDRS